MEILSHVQDSHAILSSSLRSFAEGTPAYCFPYIVAFNPSSKRYHLQVPWGGTTGYPPIMMRKGVNYAILCEGTRKYASLASVCEAPVCARYASSHARKYALTPLRIIAGLAKS